ncbi:MAG: hypothetical protein IT438_05385 [Phycisphaerales bacterium]|nr:hypothetical protein [Phycisphaerales bacterium]
MQAQPGVLNGATARIGMCAWLVLVGLLARAAGAQCVPTPIVRMGGAITQVAYDTSTRAVVSRGQFLDVVDLTDPFAPVVAGTVDAGELISDIAVVEGVAFVSFGRTVASFDVGVSPPAPLLVTQLPLGPFETITELVRTGERFNPRLCVHAGATYIYSVGAFGQMTLLSTVGTFGGAIGIAGDLLVTSTVMFSPQVQMLRVFDISNPAAPVQRGTWQGAGNYGFQHSIAGANQRVYLGVGTILYTYNVANPDSPQLVNTRSVGSDITGLAIAGWLFASTQAPFSASSGSGLKVLSLADPSAPTVIGTYSTVGMGSDLAVGASRVQLACAEAGLYILNVNNPATPSYMSNLLTAPGRADSVTVVGNTAYVAAGRIGVWIIDITNPAAPQVRSLAPSSDAQSVAVSGNRMYIADGFEGMRIYDVSNLSVPILRSSFNPPGAFETVRIGLNGSTAVLCNLQSGGSADIVDVSNDAAPVLRSTIDNDDYFFDVAFWGSRAYFANSYRGLSIYDLGNPAAPVARLVGTPGSTQTRSLAAGGSTVYVNSGGTFQIVDALLPATPLLIGQASIGGSDELRVVGGRAYAPTINGSSIIDLARPQRPVRITELDSPQYARSIAVHSSGALVEGNALNGLTIYPALTQWKPVFRDPLLDRRACARALVDLSNDFSASPAATVYHWFRQGEPALVDGLTTTGSIIAGVGAATLTIQNASSHDNGLYRCMVTNSCGTTTSNGIQVTVCMGDHNCSGTVTVQDIFDFLASYFAGDIAADVNRSGTLSVQDIFDFLTAYFGGC